MITSEIFINKCSNNIEFDEHKLNKSIEDAFKNIGDETKKIKKITPWYYIKLIFCCRYTKN
jgi:hypothetical protein